MSWEQPWVLSVDGSAFVPPDSCWVPGGWPASPAHEPTDDGTLDDAGEETYRSGPAPTDARAWLRDRLTGRGSLEAGVLLAEARTAGYSRRSVQRAREQLGATARRQGFGKGSTVVWELTTGGDDAA